MGASGDLVIFVLLLVMTAFFIPLIFDFSREYRFYKAIQKIAQSSDAIQTLSALVNPQRGTDTFSLTPFSRRSLFATSAYPRKVVAEALQSLQKSIAALISFSEKDAKEYREYIEVWSHEIKTPLTAATLLASNMNDKNKFEILEELQRIDNYVEQALFFARSYDANQDFSVSSQDVTSLIKKAIASRKNMLIASDAKIDISVEPGNLHVYCDPKWIVFALGQIIDNACKYARDGISPEIAFSAHVEDASTAHESVVLSVTDKGKGIPSFDIKRIFDKGYVGKNGRSGQKAKSTGIGLYLLEKIGRQVGFDIDVESFYYEEAAPGASYTTVSLIFSQNVSR